jgi:hypothetical protein
VGGKVDNLPSWFPFVLFGIWSLNSFISAAARLTRYRLYQREPWLITDAIKQTFQGVAFGMGSLVVSPHPTYDFEFLREWSRLMWLCGLLPFLVGTALDWYRLAAIAEQRSKRSD